MPDGSSRPAEPDLARLIPAVTALYAGAPRASRHFVGGKLRIDPLTPALMRAAREAGGLGHVLDLGCGRGQFGLALLQAGLATRVTGLDLDRGRIAEARQAARGRPATFEAADAATAPYPACDTVLMADVLYQLPEGCQADVLVRLAHAARQRLVLRLFDPGQGWRSALGLAMERAGRALRRDGAAVEPMPVASVVALLGAEGFSCRVTPCWGRTPLPNVLLLGERDGSGRA